MSKFKIWGEDLLVNWRNELQDVYEVDGLKYANNLLMSIVRCVNKKPEIYGKEFLPALLKLKIVKKILKEVEMVEEQKVEEKGEVTEAPVEETTVETEPKTDTPVAEISPEAPQAETKTVQEQLAEQVRACFVEGKCEDLGAKFDEAAEELGVPVSKLIDEVFELAKEG